ncbi:response regulator transcription factor [Quadrisphaera sp. INWT6]|uniref:response regulator transcription factor n=1 Tax=Quadrisphaera sp. INWT6 TaxID=2596917 RepID=UPI0018926D20|nr:helix-turn-helix transcriptional regulator [Quadrisphaera sp. INWT6]
MPDSTSRLDIPSQAASAASWASLLQAVADGGVRVVLSTDDGSRVALLAEKELLDLQQAADGRERDRVVLTARERQALLLVEEGLSTAQVAERLDIAHGTVVQHLAAARRKYGVRTSVEAAARAREALALD